MLLSVEPCVWNTFSIDRDVYEAEINTTTVEIVGIKVIVDKRNETTLISSSPVYCLTHIPSVQMSLCAAVVYRCVQSSLRAKMYCVTK